MVIVASANEESRKHVEASLRQRGQPASAATPAGATPAAASGTAAAPERKAGSDTQGGRSGTSVKVLLGALAVLGINHVMNNLMEESGLPALLSHGRLVTSPARNASATALFVAAASDKADALLASSGSLMRIEIMAERPTFGRSLDGEVAPPTSFSLVQVHRRTASAEDVTLTALADAAASVSSRLRLDPPIRLRTVFPERSRWALGPTTTTAELPELGQLALIVELKRIEVVAQHADAFAKAFVHLGYTSLGEPGVLRCDLFVEDVRATTVTDGGPAPLAAFLARKVFKTSADAAAHAGSEHYVAWAARVQPMLGGNGLAAARQELDTIYPHTSPFPFRSGWQTV